MSCYLAAAKNGRIELLADGAVIDPQGRLESIRDKVWKADDIPLVVTGRGNFAMVEGLARGVMLIADQYRSFDRTMEELHRTFTRERAKGTDAPFAELVIAGISEIYGPRVYLVATQGVTGIRPLVLHDARDSAYGGPILDRAMLMNFVSNGLAGRAVETMETIRAVAGIDPTNPALGEVHAVGGHVTLATVTRAGATIERLHSWPDRIGEPIDPRAA